MKQRRHLFGSRALALLLVLCLALAPSVFALTPDELKVLLQEYYLDEVTDATLSKNSVDEILKELGDPYTQYMTAEEYRTFLETMQDQELVGIGIGTEAAPEGLRIMTVYDDAPAFAAGLKPGDLVLAVDGKTAKGQSPDTVISWLRGEKGVAVTLNIQHTDGTTQEYSIVRDKIVTPLTTATQLDSGVVYIDCLSFGDQTAAHFQKILQTYPQAPCWMVDLRANPGGNLQALTDTLGLFLGKNRVFYMRDGKNQYVYSESDKDAVTKKPLIVLTSGWSASASEIFASVVRDAQAGLLIGETSYGKGVTQVLLDESVFPQVFQGGDALKVTAYRNFLPSGNTPDRIGVIPHLLVDAQLAVDVATLLKTQEPPSAQRSSHIKLTLGGMVWFVDTAASQKNAQQAALTALLEAIPPHAPLQVGSPTGTWTDTTAAAVAKQCGLTGYRARGFTDVTGSVGTAINTLATYELLKGDGSGKFRPDGQMTRAELCALLVQAFGLKQSTKRATFLDVKDGDWFAGAVRAANAAGLMNGVGNARFDPQGLVTQEQLITVLARATTKINAMFYETEKKWSPDNDTISDSFSIWSHSAVWLMTDATQQIGDETVNLLFDQVRNIAPQAAATRAQAAQMLYQIMAYTNIVPL